jgi:hypothetical protein
MEKLLIIAKSKEKVLNALKNINANINYPYQFKDDTLIDVKNDKKFRIEILSNFEIKNNIIDANLVIFFVDCNLNKANLYEIIEILKESDAKKYIIIPEREFDKIKDLFEGLDAKIETDKCDGDDYSIKTYETDIVSAIESIKSSTNTKLIITIFIVILGAIIIAYLTTRSKTLKKESIPAEQNLSTKMPVENNITNTSQKEQNYSKEQQTQSIKSEIDKAIKNNDIVLLKDLYQLVSQNESLKEYYCQKVKSLKNTPAEIQQNCGIPLPKKEKEQKITILSQIEQAYKSMPFLEFLDFIKKTLSKRCNELSEADKEKIKTLLTNKQKKYAKNLVFDVPATKETLEKDIRLYANAFFGKLKVDECFYWDKTALRAPPFNKKTFKYVKLINSYLNLIFKKVGVGIENETFKELPSDIKLVFFIKDNIYYELEMAYTKKDGKITIIKPKHAKGIIEDEINIKNILVISYFHFKNKIQVSLLLQKSDSEKPFKSFIKDLALKKEYKKAITNFFKDPNNVKNFERKSVNFYIPLTNGYYLTLSPF